MKISEEQVWAYLNGELDEETAKDVARAIAEDAALQQIADDYEVLLKGLRQKRTNAYAAEAMEVIETVDTPQKPSSRRSWWLIIAAAFLIGSIAWVVSRPAPPEPEDIAKEFFRLPADPSVAGGTASDNFNAGLDAFFSAQDYDAAIQNWSTILSDSLYGNSASYYLGHAYFLHQEYDNAFDQLQNSVTQEALFSPAELADLRWNILITRLARGEDISAEVTTLPSSPEREALLEALDKLDFN